MHFANLFHLSERGIFWVTRAKDNLRYHVCRKRLRKPQGRILLDDKVTLKVPASRRQYPHRLCRIEAEVEVNGEWVLMVFLSNNFEWAASSVCDLYRCRIEVFFKQIKQTFKVCDFFGHSKQAIRSWDEKSHGPGPSIEDLRCILEGPMKFNTSGKSAIIALNYRDETFSSPLAHLDFSPLLRTR